MIARLLPLLLFLGLGVLLAVGLGRSDHKTDLPSPLIGKSIPTFSLPLLGRDEIQISESDLIGQPFLLNVWASWCPPCRVEHPLVTRLAESGRIRVIGFNYRDEAEDALNWLDHFGNPYELVLADPSGRTAIDFGVYAAPESFLVDAEGRILYKHIGALTQEAIDREILTRLESMELP